MQLTHLSFIIGWNGYCLSLENKVVSFRIQHVFFLLLLNRLTFHWEWNNKGFWQFVDRDVIRLIVSFFWCALPRTGNRLNLVHSTLMLWSLQSLNCLNLTLINGHYIWFAPKCAYFYCLSGILFGFYLFLPPTLIFLALFSYWDATLESFLIRFDRRS